MAIENTIGILIAAKNEASSVINQVAVDAKAASASVAKSAADAAAAQEAAMKKMSANLKDTGAILTNSITLPVIGIAAVSTDLAYKFNNAMELLHTSAGIPQDQISALSDKVLSLAGTTGQAPEKLAQGLYHVASAGNGIWNTSQQLDILQTAAEGANLGLASLDDTTYALTSAMASGVKGASSASQMMSVLAATVGAGDMKMSNLNAALGTGILSTAASYGTSVQSVGAALATLTDNGESADEAATRLRMTMALMASPSSIAAKQLQALGLTAEDAKNATASMNTVFAQSGLTTTKLADDLRQPNGIGVAIEDLKNHMEDAGLSASEADAMLSKAFGGGRSDAALLTLLQNTTRIDDKFSAINSGATQTQNKLNDLNSTPNQKLRDAWSSMQASLIRIGDDLLPIAAQWIGVVAGDVANLAKWWDSLNGSQKTALEWLVGILAIGGPILKGTGQLISDIQTVGGLFKDLKKPASDALGAVSDGFGHVVDDVIPKAKSAISDFVTKTLPSIGSAAKNAVSDLASKGGSAGSSWIKAAADAAKGWAKSFANITKTVATEGPGIALRAVDAGLAWTLNATRVGLEWTANMVLVGAQSTLAAIKATPGAIAAGAVWAKNAAVASAAWVTIELPKIVKAGIITAASSSTSAVAASVAWSRNAAVAATAWVTVQLPRIVLAGVATATSAVVQSGVTAAAWVSSSAKSAEAWVLIRLPQIISSFVLTSAAAVANAAVTSGAYVASAVTSSASWVAFRALVASPLAMGGIAIAGALADIALVSQAIQSVQNAINALNQAKQAAANVSDIQQTILNHATQVINDGVSSPAQKAAQKHLVNQMAKESGQKPTYPGFATGTNFAPGGLSMVHKDELIDLPTGSKVHTARETKQMLQGSKGVTINIGSWNNNNNMDEDKFLAKLGWRLSLA